MKRVLLAIVLLVSTTTMTSCGVAMLVVAGVLAGQVSAKDRQTFAAINVERETAGLEPLTWDEYRKHKSTDSEEQSDETESDPGPADGGGPADDGAAGGGAAER